jgi:Porin PorA
MRARVVGWAVIGLGGLAIAASATAPSWVPLTPVDLRLDESSGTASAGEGVGYVDPVSLEQATSDEVSVSVRIRGDEDAGDADDDTAVWESVSETNDANGTLIATETTVACLDRRTAAAEDCVVGSVDGERVEVRGLTVRFPADTGRRDYDLWDTTVREPFPARYVGAESLDGLQVYRFEQEVPEQVIRSVPVPGALVGSTEDELEAEVVHSSTTTLLVDPLSGVIVSTEARPVTALRAPDGTPGAVLLSGTFRSTEDAVDDAVDRALDIADDRAGLQSVVRWTAAALGAALLAAGLLLVLHRRPEPDATRPDPAQDEPVRVPVPSA